jgi:carboxymethylenebutenolidase
MMEERIGPECRLTGTVLKSLKTSVHREARWNLAPGEAVTCSRSTWRRAGLVIIVLFACLLVGNCADPGEDAPKASDRELIRSISDPPPSEVDAAEALAASPRRGEWVELELIESDRPITTWIVRPEGSGDAPVVLVIHEIFGLTDWVRAVADRLAENGFVAVVPDLLSGLGPDGGGTESMTSRDESVRRIRALDPADVLSRLDAVREHASRLAMTTGQVAVVGFCWGGSTGFAYAVTEPRLEAAVIYYGNSPVDTVDYHLIEAPVLGLYGGDDERVNATIAVAEREMSLLGRRYEAQVFAGAGHGFLRAQAARDGANRVASEQAWRRTIEFLRQNLAVGGEKSTAFDRR